MSIIDPRTGRPLVGGADPHGPTHDDDPDRLAAHIRGRDPGGGGEVIDGLGRAEAMRAQQRDPYRPRNPEDVTDSTELHRIYHRPRWHEVATPEPVAAAWRVFLHAADRIDDYDRQWHQLDLEERAALPAADSAAYAALKAGQDPPAEAPVLDHSAGKRAALAAMTAALRLAVEQRSTYDRVVIAELAGWRAAVVDQFEPLQPAAQQAWHSFEQTWRAWRRTVAMLGALNRAIGHPDGPTPSRRQAEQFDTAGKGMDALRGLLGSADPTITGGWAAEPLDAEPPRWRRAQMAERPDERLALARIEQAERDAGTTITTHIIP